MLEQVLSESKPNGMLLQGLGGRQTLPEKGGFAALLESTLAPEKDSLPSLKGASSAVLANLPFDTEVKGLQVAGTRVPFSTVLGASDNNQSLSVMDAGANIAVALGDAQASTPPVGELATEGLKGVVSLIPSEGMGMAKPVGFIQDESIQEHLVSADNGVISAGDGKVVDASQSIMNEPQERGSDQSLISPVLSDVLSEPLSDDLKNVVGDKVEKPFAALPSQRSSGNGLEKGVLPPGLMVSESGVDVQVGAHAVSENSALSDKLVHPAHPEQAQNLTRPEKSAYLVQAAEAGSVDFSKARSDEGGNESGEGQTSLTDSVMVDGSSENESSITSTLEFGQVNDDLSPDDVVQAAPVQEHPTEQLVIASGQDLTEDKPVSFVVGEGRGTPEVSAGVKGDAGSVNHTVASSGTGGVNQAVARNPLSFEHGSSHQGHQNQGQQSQGQGQQQGQSGQGSPSQQQFAQMAQNFVQTVQSSRQQNIERQFTVQSSAEGSAAQNVMEAEASNNVLTSDRRLQLPQGLQTIGLPVTHQRWGQALGQRVVYMANNQVQQAQITLNPEKLGPVQIKLHVDRDQQVHVVMTAQHGVTREAMEAAMPRLKEMMEQAGIDLGSVDVNDQREFQQDSNDDDQAGQAKTSSGMIASAEVDSVAEEANLQTYSTDSLVDYYA